MCHVSCRKKLNSMFPWCSSVELTFYRGIFIRCFWNTLCSSTVLDAGCQKRRLQTDLTLTGHPFSQSWPVVWRNLDALTEEGCSWYVSSNVVEYSETAVLWLVEKNSRVHWREQRDWDYTNTAAVLCCCPWPLSQAHSRMHSACCSRSTVTKLAGLITRQIEAQVYWYSWQHTEEYVNLSCKSLLWCRIPRVLTKQCVQGIQQSWGSQHTGGVPLTASPLHVIHAKVSVTSHTHSERSLHGSHETLKHSHWPLPHTHRPPARPRTCPSTLSCTHTAPACPPPGTCAAGTPDTCDACTCPSHTCRRSCRRTVHPWWRCGGRSPCSLHSSTRCSGSRRPCPHTHCTPHFPAS